MADFLVYHNPDKMGHPASEVADAAIVTNKEAPAGVKGSRIWLLTGEGTPRNYFLCGVFTATAVTAITRPSFQTRVTGDWLKLIPRSKWRRMNDLPWFPAFRKAQGNFAFGLQVLRDPVTVNNLKQLIEID